MFYPVPSLSDLPIAARAIRDGYPAIRIFLLEGELGSGKTTFVKAFCEVLGIREPVTSPTFNIIHVYEEGDTPVYHFDLYRIKNSEELEEIGFEEYLCGDAYIFIEWPELALPFLEGEDYVLIRLGTVEKGRNLSAELIVKS